ncbi:MAG: hypothetical protein N0C89_15625 [Candidatus Thiodiazotropha endolucinida]|nr:hypothetical protein [Candidatus Thiodiazotropha taylori]MCG8093154.1 hypothetical protein [Candidatus Thiodiazotropha endolucinida]MCG8060779.1 hypothetical protein [Candidatus Thiodiazotropha taylori]MCG8065554.1 hypothetical protein [Candidatus Thiodiazotropha taylori]MCW4331649.1 hypothetical protein [Candidatus Thiodiazotropha endolucinida]
MSRQKKPSNFDRDEERAVAYPLELMPEILEKATSLREQSGLELSMFTVNRLLSNGN